MERKKFQKEPSVSSPVSPAFKTDDERKARKGLISLNNIHILKTPSDLGEWKTDLFTFLEINQLRHCVCGDAGTEMEKMMTLSVIRKTVSKKCCAYIRLCDNPYKAYNLLRKKVLGSEKDHQLDLVRKLVRIQYNSLNSYITQFQNIVDEMCTIDREFPKNPVVFQIFRALLPKVAKQYDRILDSAQVSNNLIEYIEALLNLIPKHILIQKTKPDKTNNKKSNSNKGNININGAVIDKPTPTEGTSWISGSAVHHSFPDNVNQQLNDMQLNMSQINTNNVDLSLFWCLDSGASFHVCSNRTLLQNIRPCSPNRFLAHNHTISTSTECGDFVLRFGKHKILLENIPILSPKCNNCCIFYFP